MPVCLKCGTKNIQTTSVDPNATQSAQLSKNAKKGSIKTVIIAVIVILGFGALFEKIFLKRCEKPMASHAYNVGCLRRCNVCGLMTG